MSINRKSALHRVVNIVLCITGILILAAILILLRFAQVTDYMYHALVKDPERTAPSGQVIVAPADGTVIYIKPVTSGTIPSVVKEGVAVPLEEHLKMKPSRLLKAGYLIGIYMNTYGVHINRVPNNGAVIGQFVYNGPHMDMTEMEKTVILTQLIPGTVSIRRAMGLPPFNIADKADYIVKSARETLVIEEERGATIYIVRIADYYVGRILTWVEVGAHVKRGQKLGMIARGSQTDMYFETSPEMRLSVRVGDYVYGGETVIATY